MGKIGRWRPPRPSVMQIADAQTPMRASLFMVAAMAIIGVIDNYVIRLAETIGLWQFHLTRAAMMFPLVMLMAALGLGGLRPRRLWAVALRSLLLATAMLFYFSALALMPIAQALAGLFTSPIFVLILTALGLRQKVGPGRVVAVALGFTGILCVLQPDPSNFDLLTLVPMAGGFFYALAAICTRSLCAQESTVSLLGGMVLTLGAMGALGLAAMALWPMEALPGAGGFVTRGWIWPMDRALPYVILQAVGSVTAVFMLIKAYQLGEPSHVAVFEYTVMIFGPFYAWYAFGQPVGPWQLAGIGLIVLAGSIIALRTR